MLSHLTGRARSGLNKIAGVSRKSMRPVPPARLFLWSGCEAAEVVAFALHEESGVWLQRAVESLALAVHFLAVDSYALRQRVAGVWVVGFELDIPADAVRDVDRPAVSAGWDFLPGV